MIICKPSIDQFSHDLTTLVLDENEFFEDPSDKIYQLAKNALLSIIPVHLVIDATAPLLLKTAILKQKIRSIAAIKAAIYVCRQSN